MRKLIVFNSVTVDGYFSGEGGDISWAHRADHDKDWDAFVAANAGAGSLLLLGRVTYELMIKYWPTPAAMRDAPVVAERMNNLPKVVFSRTLHEPSWNNTRVVKDGMEKEVKKLKKDAGPHMTVLGSGSIVSQLARHGLVDEYQIVITPVVLGRGTTMFEGLEKTLNLELTNSRTFGNGNIVVSYQPSR